jgi:hypothetical protein
MKISRACSKCIAFPICDVGYPNRGNDACRNFHDAMESKITAHNKQSMPCRGINECPYLNDLKSCPVKYIRKS